MKEFQTNRKRRRTYGNIKDNESEQSFSETRSLHEKHQNYQKEDQIFKMKLRDDINSLQLRIEEMNN